MPGFLSSVPLLPDMWMSSFLTGFAFFLFLFFFLKVENSEGPLFQGFLEVPRPQSSPSALNRGLLGLDRRSPEAETGGLCLPSAESPFLILRPRFSIREGRGTRHGCAIAPMIPSPFSLKRKDLNSSTCMSTYHKFSCCGTWGWADSAPWKCHPWITDAS